jgi:hypothetical protein
MMTDIVERLLTPQGGWLDPLRKEAADEIGQLRFRIKVEQSKTRIWNEEVERLRKVLAIEGLSCKSAADIERQQTEIERLQWEKAKSDGEVADRNAEIERLQALLAECRPRLRYNTNGVNGGLRQRIDDALGQPSSG